MEVGGLLGVEAETRCGGRKADRDGGTAGEVKTSQSQFVGGLTDAVNAMPNSLQCFGFQH